MSVISQLLSRIFYNVDPYPNVLPGPGKATQPPARPSDLQPPQAEAIFPGPGSGVRQPSRASFLLHLGTERCEGRRGG